MAEVITNRKNQIRPRSRAIRFNDDAIKAMTLDGNDRVLITDPYPLSVQIDRVVFIANIVQVYADLDATNPYWTLAFALGPSVAFLDDFDSLADEDFNNVSQLFTNAGINTVQISNPVRSDWSADFQYIEPGFSAGNTLPYGDLVLSASNDGVAYTGGDPANYLDVIVYYNLVRVAAA